MSSAAKIAANRRNAQRSTGPRSAAGKRRVARNAFRHGLASRKGPADKAAAERIEALARSFAAGSAEPVDQELAHRAAEAQFEIVRLRCFKVHLINRASIKLREATIDSRSQHERAAVAFAQKSKTFKAFDRYERRGVAKRNRALRELRLARAARLKEPPELVGPPRPNDRFRGNPFVRDPVRLELHSILKVLMLDPSKLPHRPFSDFHRFQLGASNMPITVAVWLNGLEGGLRLTFAPRDRQLVQQFEIKGKRMRVGGIRWQIQCPETKRMVRELFLIEGEEKFRSRNALKLVYRSQHRQVVDRRFARLCKLMNRIGATDTIMLAPRPKHMRRRTYERLCREIEDANRRWRVVALGRSPSDFGLD